MDFQAIVRAVELRGREVGSQGAAMELEHCTPARAHRVLALLKTGDYCGELPMLNSAASLVYGDRDLVSVGGAGSVEDVLKEAGIEPLKAMRLTPTF